MIIKNVQVYDDLSLYVIHVIMIDVYMKKMEGIPVRVVLFRVVCFGV